VDLLVSGLISSDNSLQKTGSGTLRLTNANTYTRSTFLDLGVIEVTTLKDKGTASSLGTGNATATTDVIRMGTTSTATLTYIGTGDSTNRRIQIGTGTVASSTGGATLLNNGSGALTLKNSNFNSPVNTGNTTDVTSTARTLTLGGTNTGANTIQGVIADNTGTETPLVNLVKQDAGTWVLSGNNTYTGATTISAGTLQIGAGGTSGAISSTSGITNNGTLAINRSDALTVSTIISGTGAVTKDGAGTLTLTGNNTYTGATTVNAGTLQAAATRALGNSTVINVNGGSFLVTAENAVNDTAAINLGGGRMAASGNFSETVGALTLSANSIIDFSGFVGTLRFSGIGSWASGANLAIWNWSGTTQYGTQVNNYANPSNLVFTTVTSNLTDNLANISFYSDSGNSFVGSGFEVTGFSGGGSQIIAVPETETYFYAVALLAGLVVQYLRRRAKRKPLEGHRPA
jgi:fibronectin-binding autotransporter adhesin